MCTPKAFKLRWLWLLLLSMAAMIKASSLAIESTGNETKALEKLNLNSTECYKLQKSLEQSNWTQLSSEEKRTMNYCTRLLYKNLVVKPKFLQDTPGEVTSVNINNDMPVWLIAVLVVFVIIGLIVIGYVIKLLVTKDAAKEMKKSRSKRVAN